MSFVIREIQKTTTVQGHALACDGCGKEAAPVQGNQELHWPAGWIGMAHDKYAEAQHFCGRACAIASLNTQAPAEPGGA